MFLKLKGTEMIHVKVKKLHEDAVLPTRANNTDTGFDIVAIDDGTEVKEYRHAYIQYRTGISIEPPEGYYVEVFPRSSISKTGLMLANSVAIIDQGYRGEILLRFRLVDQSRRARYSKGDRIAQLVVKEVVPMVFNWVDELSDTARGEGGFGSSGK